jgi:PEP-CTERM motif-containing protein
VTDVHFFLPGTATEATTSSFGLIFTDVEVAGLTEVQFFDANDNLIFTRDALVAGNQGLSFLGVAFDDAVIGRIRITSGSNTIVSNSVLGNPNDDIVVMDDFLYAEPSVAAVPEPQTYALTCIGLMALALVGRRRALQASTTRR